MSPQLALPTPCSHADWFSKTLGPISNCQADLCEVYIENVCRHQLSLQVWNEPPEVSWSRVGNVLDKNQLAAASISEKGLQEHSIEKDRHLGTLMLQPGFQS